MSVSAFTHHWGMRSLAPFNYPISSVHLPHFSPGNKGSVPGTAKIHTEGHSLCGEHHIVGAKVVVLTLGFAGMRMRHLTVRDGD
jgi:hypothetical protein